MYLRTMRVGVRAGLGFAVMALMVAMTGMFCLSNMSTLRNNAQVIENVWMPGIETIHDCAASVAVIRQEALRLIANRNEHSHVESEAAITAERAALERNLANYEAAVRGDEDRQLFEALKPTLADYLSVTAHLMETVGRGDSDQAYAVLNERLAPIGKHVDQQLEALISFNQKGADLAAQNGDTVYQHSQRIVLCAVLGAMLVTLLLAYWLTRSIVAPLREALSLAECIERGDLTHKVDVHGKDEPALLLAALASMQHKLCATLRGIGDSADQLAASAEQMSAVMEESNRDLQQQTDEINQAATAVTQMSSAVDEVAGNAVSTAEVTRVSDEQARVGEEKVADTVTAIQCLVDDVVLATEQAGGLEQQAQNISVVLDVIRSIAAQTNLLALNAAIEAARAGESGRGFAVVADEVRSLAQRTQDSTTEIEQMIGMIQDGTEGTVQALERSAEQAGKTLESAGHARQALQHITASMGQINERNLVIASATEQQALVAREVDRSLVRIRDLSSQTATGAHQTSAASQSLAQLAADLSGLVARFRL